MKKFFTIIFFAMLSMTALAQSSNISVCGIKMGTPKEDAKAILKERFGSLYVFDEGGKLKVFDGEVGGITYKILEFEFTWVNGKPRLNGVYFENPYELNDQKEAIKTRDLIMSIYRKKYDIKEIEDGGFKCYFFGDAATSEIYGHIWLSKGKSKDGKVRLHLEVYYNGPYPIDNDI